MCVLGSLAVEACFDVCLFGMGVALLLLGPQLFLALLFPDIGGLVDAPELVPFDDRSTQSSSEPVVTSDDVDSVALIAGVPEVDPADWAVRIFQEKKVLEVVGSQIDSYFGVVRPEQHDEILSLGIAGLLHYLFVDVLIVKVFELFLQPL